MGTTGEQVGEGRETAPVYIILTCYAQLYTNAYYFT